MSVHTILATRNDDFQSHAALIAEDEGGALAMGTEFRVQIFGAEWFLVVVISLG